jgi:hypothetical protein
MDNKSTTPMINAKLLSIFFTATLAFNAPLVLGQDATLTNYKTGIDTTFSGTAGTDYQEEYFYSDKLISDRKVVYIKAGTSITLAHNARNVSYLYVNQDGYGPVSGGKNGVITYKLDQDLGYGPCWGDANGTYDTFLKFGGGAINVTRTNNPTYTAPFTLASLAYADSTPVVGTTGPTPGYAIADWGHYYWRGILDSIGDEWHVLTVADYDGDFVSNSEYKSSDGKVILFVVNPKTPCLTITTTGNAQFYTTPPKIYFIPKIHSQTTYFAAGTGTISFSLKDINGNDVYYRINGGTWSHARNPILSASDFTAGSNTLEYYYAGNATYTKKRIIVKDPSFPSANEAHGNLLWKDTKRYNAIVSRLANDPFKSHYELFLRDDYFNPLADFDRDFRQGKRICYGKYALGNAFAARVLGWAACPDGKSKTSALYAKQMLLESERTIDPVGFEINHSGRSIPARELFYRGYYDVDATFSLAFTYDLLIANYKATQYTDGITAIEDYFIRDQLAGCAFDAMLVEGNYTMQEYENAGMWGIARNIGGLVVAMAMPAYSTPYYGTSGFDGNTTVYPWTPFPDTPLTWKKVFLDNDAMLVGYPNLNYRFGIEEYLISPDGHFNNRVDYFMDYMMGHCCAMADNMVKIYAPTTTFPNLQKAWKRSAEGTLLGLQNITEGTRQFVQITILNDRFPDVARIASPWLLNFGAANGQPAWSLMLNNRPYGLFWNENPTPPITPHVNTTVVSPK